jgi:hypothetical protein
VVPRAGVARLRGGKSALVRERTGGVAHTNEGRIICAAQPGARLEFGRFMHDVGAMISVSAIVFEDVAGTSLPCFCAICRRFISDELSMDWRRFSAERNPAEWMRYEIWRRGQVVRFLDTGLARACAGRHGLWTSLKLDVGDSPLMGKLAASGLFDAWIGHTAVLTSPDACVSMRALWQYFDSNEAVAPPVPGRSGIVVEFGGWPDVKALKGGTVGAARAAVPVNRNTVGGAMEALQLLASDSPSMRQKIEHLLSEYPRMVSGSGEDIFEATRAFLADEETDMFTRLAELNRIIEGLEELVAVTSHEHAARIGSTVRLLSVARVSLLDAAEESAPIKHPQRQATPPV